jgi:hypothetical protein
MNFDLFIQLLTHLDPTELKEFLDERKRLEELELKEVAEKRAAKLMRASNIAAAAAAKK